MKSDIIYIHTSQISASLKSKEISNSQELKVINDKLMALKKKGMQAPTPVADQEDQKYKEEKKAYDQYTSVEYHRAVLAYKLTRKIRKLSYLRKNNAKNPSENKTKMIETLLNDLKGGLNKPVFEDIEKIKKDGTKTTVQKIKGHTIRMHFSDLGDIPTDASGIDQKIAATQIEFNETNVLFDKKRELINKNIKIPKSVKNFVAYVLQESIADIVTNVLKEVKKTESALTIDYFNRKNLEKSNFSPLFNNLSCVEILENHLARKEAYDQDIKRCQENFKNTNDKLYVLKSFSDIEKSNGHMKETENGKHWKGLNVEDVRLVSQATKIIDHIKNKLKINKLRVSRRAKEFVSKIMQEFLEKLSKRFQIMSEYRKRVDSLTSNEDSKLKKTVTLYDIVEMFDILLCTDDQYVKNVLNTADQIKLK